jgi:hypothetical protein
MVLALNADDRCLVSDVWCPMPGARCLVNDDRCPMSGV